MLKPIFLATAMMISAPALAQDVPSQTGTSPAQDMTAPTGTPAPQTAPAESAPTPESADPTATDSTATQSAATPTTGEPAAASATQIAQVVETEFPTYDKDSDGEITKAEFGTWMVALRSATDPNTNAQSAEVQTWVGQAFVSADADKSTKVSKAELTTFLSQGAS